MGPLSMYLISATITPNKIIAAVVVVVVVVAAFFFWRRSRAA